MSHIPSSFPPDLAWTSPQDRNLTGDPRGSRAPSAVLRGVRSQPLARVASDIPASPERREDLHEQQEAEADVPVKARQRPPSPARSLRKDCSSLSCLNLVAFGSAEHLASLDHGAAKPLGPRPLQEPDEEDDDDDKPLSELVQNQVEPITSPYDGVKAVASRAALGKDSGEYIEFTLWTPTDSRLLVEADCLYLTETYHCSGLPPLAEEFVHQGFRVILPRFESLARHGGPATVERMVQGVGSVLLEVKRQDTLLRNGQSVYSGSTPRSSLVVQDTQESPLKRPGLEPLRMSSANIKPIRPAIKQRATCAVGEAVGGLIAALYAVRVSPYCLPHASRPKAPLWQRLMVRRSSFKSSAGSNKPASSVSTPALSALVLISPQIEPHPTGSRNSFKRSSRVWSSETNLHVLADTDRAQRPTKPVVEAMRQLRAQTGLIRIPTLMLHGSRHSQVSSQAMVSLYEALGARDKCLSLYPSSVQLTQGRSDTSEHAFNEILAWLKERQCSSATAAANKGRVKFSPHSQMITDPWEDSELHRCPARSDEELVQPSFKALRSLSASAKRPYSPSTLSKSQSLPRLTVSTFPLGDEMEESLASTYSSGSSDRSRLSWA